MKNVILLIFVIFFYTASYSQPKLSQRDIVGKWKISAIIVSGISYYDFEKDSISIISEIMLQTIKLSESNDSLAFINRIKDGFKKQKNQTTLFNLNNTYSTFIDDKDDKKKFELNQYSFDDDKQEITLKNSKLSSPNSLDFMGVAKIYIEDNKLFLIFDNNGNKLTLISKKY